LRERGVVGTAGCFTAQSAQNAPQAGQINTAILVFRFGFVVITKRVPSWIDA
jgi:hypothetical protein